METKITKGEWEVIRRPITHVTSKGHGLICEMIPGDGLGTIDANARLIAAAPDLYEALMEIVVAVESGIMVLEPSIGQNVDYIGYYDKAVKALQKATE